MGLILDENKVSEKLSNETDGCMSDEDFMTENSNQQLSKDIWDIKTKLARLEAERVEMARREIQAVLDKYGVKLQGVVILPATQIQIIPER